MKLFILLLLCSTAFAHPKSNKVVSDDGKSVCLKCSAAEGICNRTCRDYVCVKSTEHQMNSERRYCMSALEPGLPKPGECMTYKNELGQSETFCTCTGDYCNSSDGKACFGGDALGRGWTCFQHIHSLGFKYNAG
ncbi:hypothetical protein M3Y97_00293100 [Aphelenchoides bicaudatus]|nr:hypothetical protein M3Y97_00293100 [Aphelenchoides bicaudatus]